MTDLDKCCFILLVLIGPSLLPRTNQDRLQFSRRIQYGVVHRAGCRAVPETRTRRRTGFHPKLDHERLHFGFRRYSGSERSGGAVASAAVAGANLDDDCMLYQYIAVRTGRSGVGEIGGRFEGAKASASAAWEAASDVAARVLIKGLGFGAGEGCADNAGGRPIGASGGV